MSETDQERRVSKRNEVSLTAVVKGRESDVKYWKEQTSIVTVSRLGASFNLTRQFKAGRILSLITKMPKGLRCYDEDKKLYRVWGLVQHCSPVFGEEDSNFQIGIAFIGKNPPESYTKDPLKTYRIIGMDEDGFWNIGESKTPFISRSHHRFPCCLEVRLAAIDSDGNETDVSQDAVTDNVSYGGALVFSDLEVTSGDAIRFTCEKYDYSSIAVVRNRQEREGNRTTLHLQFMESNFPVKEIDLPYLEQPEIEGAEELSIIQEGDDDVGDELDETPLVAVDEEALDADPDETSAVLENTDDEAAIEDSEVSEDEPDEEDANQEEKLEEPAIFDDSAEEGEEE